MKVLIIGHQGTLGTALMKTFEDLKPIGLDRDELDITNKKKVLETIDNHRPDLVINAAAYNAVDKCEENKEEFEVAKVINGYAPGYLAKACKAVGADLVHYSTDYVFSGDKKEGYVEADDPSPVSNYGTTKLLGEKEVMKHTKKYFIIRLSRLFGPGGSKAGKKSFFDVMCDLSRSNQKIKVVNEEVDCFTYAPDLAWATRHLTVEDGKLQSRTTKKYAYGIYHIINEGSCTWYEGALELFKRLGKKIIVVPVPGGEFPRPARRPAYSVLLNTKFPKLRSWEEALVEYLGTQCPKEKV